MDLIYTKYQYRLRISEPPIHKKVRVTKCGKIPLLTATDSQGNVEIMQILSTEPKDFLKKNLYPGERF